MENMFKVVIDTNILIGGAYDELSYSNQIIKEVIEGRIEAFATHQAMKENRLLLRKTVKDREYKKFLEAYFKKLTIVKRKKRLNVVADPDDNKFLESAVAAPADYIITSDREVLDVEEYEGIKVVHPGEFWAVYKKKSAKVDGSEWQEWGKMLLK